ncbi:MAG: Peptide chain release factor 1 [Alphaproteobacteria bacterium MarineAlpha5_Bin5]|nr:MAG: Peptide chain release factor 1 [Alphaproteobacteria bacterium MarineAlpha5_Bin5]|tara:strand:+ start:1073 stop:2149 length:1077 start_codon:yes stop_codon:yes gene_type:complete
MLNFEKQFENITKKYNEIENSLNNQSGFESEKLIKLNKEYADLKPIVNTISNYKNELKEIADLKKLLDDDDVSIKKIADEELIEKKKNIKLLEDKLMRLLIPKDKNDDKNSILEIRAGTGGDEASLFAADLFSMYQKYADINKWKFEVLSLSETGLKGIKEVICNISGYNVFSKLKFESGVHRVQRVPTTESSGRVHTSAATVAVLPEAEEVDIKLEDKDLRIDVFRSSGPGGQSVNTTDSAVRITHIPTGIVVSQQDEKSQHKNKAKAMKILRSRILDNEIQEKNKERSQERKNQVGSGDRSERIRTYNFPQGRVSDHRINLTLYNLDEILEGNLDDLITPLITNEETVKLAELGNE